MLSTKLLVFVVAFAGCVLLCTAQGGWGGAPGAPGAPGGGDGAPGAPGGQGGYPGQSGQPGAPGGNYGGGWRSAAGASYAHSLWTYCAVVAGLLLLKKLTV